MQEWLPSNNLSYNDGMVRTELLAPHKDDKRILYWYCRHTISELNPTELI